MIVFLGNYLTFGLLMSFIIGAGIYVLIEIAYDNTSHRSMAFIGGTCFVFCGALDEWFMLPDMCFWLLIALIITTMEYLAGKIWNEDYKIWDYRKIGIKTKKRWIPLNIEGQICLPFSIIWFYPIAPFLMWLDNILRFIFP